MFLSLIIRTQVKILQECIPVRCIPTVAPLDVSTRGYSLPREPTPPPRGPDPTGPDLPLVNIMTDASENITYFAVGKNGQ